jgi:hypothetical protein
MVNKSDLFAEVRDMRRVTFLFDDEQVYRDVKAEAAKEGRPVKDVVSEALRDWLRRRAGISSAERARRLRALALADDLRARLAGRDMGESVDDTLAAIRDERA